MPIQTRDELTSFIEERAIDKWERTGAPYQLSSIGTELSVNGDDYKPIIAPLKLRQFVLSTEFPRIRALPHPHHLASVALVPKEADFKFTDLVREPGQQNEDGARADRPSRFSPAARLLSILSKLSNEELERVQIPVDLLVKLHNLK